jgi:ubiquinone/menaquinone biosynthesis C-methylase UbiE
MTPRFIARQLSRPTGVLGILIGRLMNRHNANMNAFAVLALEAGPADRVLEIGFGGGATLDLLMEYSPFVAGLDRSPDVIRRTRSRFAEAVKAGRADFREGNVEAMPFESASFEKVITVNTVYFWQSLEVGLAEIYRVLAPGGRAVIGFVTREKMEAMRLPADIFTPRDPDDVVESLRRCGFNRVRLERPRPTTPWVVAVAEKQSSQAV